MRIRSNANVPLKGVGYIPAGVGMPIRGSSKGGSDEPTLPWRGTSAGGGCTTAADLMKFAGALMSNKLLKAEMLAEATRPQFTTGAYGFGFQIGRPDEARTYGHGGGAPGMNAILRVYPESGQSVIVLCNLDSPSASRLGDWVHARMPQKGLD